VTGEISVYRYRSHFKRLLSAVDGQSEPAPHVVARWQAQHHTLNQLLLATLLG
jgi:hypothetical protein